MFAAWKSEKHAMPDIVRHIPLWFWGHHRRRDYVCSSRDLGCVFRCEFAGNHRGRCKCLLQVGDEVGCVFDSH
jgi:hypothetical protein